MTDLSDADMKELTLLAQEESILSNSLLYWQQHRDQKLSVGILGSDQKESSFSLTTDTVLYGRVVQLMQDRVTECLKRRTAILTLAKLLEP